MIERQSGTWVFRGLRPRYIMSLKPRPLSCSQRYALPRVHVGLGDAPNQNVSYTNVSLILVIPFDYCTLIFF